MIDHITAYRAAIKDILTQLYSVQGATLFMNTFNPSLQCVPSKLLESKQGSKDLLTYLREKRNKNAK